MNNKPLSLYKQVRFYLSMSYTRQELRESIKRRDGFVEMEPDIDAYFYPLPRFLRRKAISLYCKFVARQELKLDDERER